jgi:hypothetical protein
MGHSHWNECGWSKYYSKYGIAGLAGGVIGIILSGGNITELKPNTQIMEEFIIPISILQQYL